MFRICISSLCLSIGIVNLGVGLVGGVSNHVSLAFVPCVTTRSTTTRKAGGYITSISATFGQDHVEGYSAQSNDNNNNIKDEDKTSDLLANKVQASTKGIPSSRRQLLHQIIATTAASTAAVLSVGGGGGSAAVAADTPGKMFAPGGTLVDYEVGVTVGNPDASKSRRADNTNVIFVQDYYFKFGTAPQWIENGATDFPKTMPFTPSQQRYETMKKYRERINTALYTAIATNLATAIQDGVYGSIADASSSEYAIRALGLFANGFLASENTGTTNELYLARWYINEIYLQIMDIKQAPNKASAIQSYRSAIKAVNSYLGMLNRVITAKVGDKFELIEPKL